MEEMLVKRAIKAFNRRFPNTVPHERPIRETSKVIRDHRGKTKVLVENTHRVLAVFRLRGDGTLRYTS